jgi:hypothetical protein
VQPESSPGLYAEAERAASNRIKRTTVKDNHWIDAVRLSSARVLLTTGVLCACVIRCEHETRTLGADHSVPARMDRRAVMPCVAQAADGGGG